MNRGIARRIVFRGRADIRFFLCLLALAVRRGEIEVHSFVIMNTHYHLLVRSPCGMLSTAMRRIQQEYVRYFNRANGRDGPLFRGRFRSRPVLSLRYRCTVVRYIDHNAVQAGMVKSPEDYPFGSAAYHAEGHRRPRWLTVGWLDAVVAAVARENPRATYASVWGRRPTVAERALVAARVRSKASLVDEWEDLLTSSPPHILAWMRRRAALADGLPAGQPVVAPKVVQRTLEKAREASPEWTMPAVRGPRVDAWGPAAVGILCQLCGVSAAAAGAVLGLSRDRAGYRLTQHRGFLARDDYGARVAELAAACLAQGAVEVVPGIPIESVPD
jgi:REP element-mobilizing transposase RayT